ncbi:MAG: HAD family hydrolase [Kiritimatiellae bacterium]|nr:HAD family hydrolase [Kiritimatiellia bacterium]
MNQHRGQTTEDLINFKPQHDAFVGIDSDGCVFPTMEIKQKQCFHKLIVSHWRLEKIERYAREAAEFANLYSKYRGRNRFPCLLLSIDLLRNRPEVLASGVKLPAFTSLKKFIDSGLPLGNPALEQWVRETGDKELASILQWSKDVNSEIARTVKNVAPFKWVRESLDFVRAQADAICVSQTPTEALVREWQEHDLMGYVKIIAGQELGTKQEHLHLATQGRYPADRILMIGDAPGDLSAARGVKGHFFPINPGHEEASWERFAKEGFNKFIDGTYGGAYEQALIAEFDRLLPETPPWISR